MEQNGKITREAVGAESRCAGGGKGAAGRCAGQHGTPDGADAFCGADCPLGLFGGGTVRILRQDGDCTAGRLEDVDGDVIMTAYAVFPGIWIVYSDVHAGTYVRGRCERAGLMEINHCREGRIEHQYGEDFTFLAPGDLSVVSRDAAQGTVSFPTGHYHGITVLIDPARAPDCLSCFLEDVNVRPMALMEKFCGGQGYFIARSSASVEHIFSELYSVPETIRKGYFKVKLLELFLFLSALPAGQEQRSYTSTQVRLAKEVSAYLLASTGERLTVAELSRRFGASVPQINNSFRGVYGMSPAAFLRAQKMRQAAVLLRETDRTVLDIAGQFGYDNGSKFARAFRSVIGVSPNACRSGISRDSCAPEDASRAI